VREVTDEEVEFLESHGWVMLRSLVSPDTAAELLEAAKELHVRAQTEWDRMPALDVPPGSQWEARDFGHSHAFRGFVSGNDLEFRKLRIEPFLSFTMSKEIGRAAHRLMNRKRLTDEEIGVRYCEDALLYLPPNEADRSHRYHQDAAFGTDRTGGFNVWVALDEVTPEQGAMRFLTNSHREGPLGSYNLGSEGSVVDHYPKLFELYELSPPFHYQPGDVTIHYGYTIHGTPENRTDRPRWSYVPTYIPADNKVLDGSPLGMPEPHERFPLVYP
jgi:hypothetical protein